MIAVHHLNDSRSQRILWMLAALRRGLPDAAAGHATGVRKMKTSPMPFFIGPVAKGISDKTQKTFIGPMIRIHLDFVEAHLVKNTWFLDDELSGADIQMSFPLEASVARGIVGRNRPHITRPGEAGACQTGVPKSP